jgi:hypothetical protein
MPNFSGIWNAVEQFQARGQNIWPATPGAPTIGTATATSGTTASVAFTAPAYTGFPAGITSYTATSSPGGLTGTGASSPIVVSGLTTGTTYTFTVTANNVTGTGPASAASNSVTPVNYIEDVMSTWLYTGNNTSQTITNGIDLSGKGGLVWIKSRAGTFVREHYLYDTARGTILSLSSDTTLGNVNNTPNGVSAYNSNGFNIVGSGGSGGNGTDTTYVSWTFREQPKFFDIVTYTGNGANRTIAHNLGSVPGMIIVKRTDTTGDWQCYHRSLANTQYLVLNSTAAVATGATRWNSTTPTSSVFSVGTDATVNASGGTYVAYIYAHDAGGFGLSGNENVISCGSFNASTGLATVNLGYEPQWVMIKAASTTGNWTNSDNMRGFPANVARGPILYANSSSAELADSNQIAVTSTGFNYDSGPVTTYIYIAIRRGPMAVPTTGTSVFSQTQWSGSGSALTTNPNITTDLFWAKRRDNTSQNYFIDRLRNNERLYSNSTAAGSTNTAQVPVNVFNSSQTVISLGADEFGIAGSTWILGAFRRAPNFFDEVCYTGTGVVGTVNHNLTVAPELMIIKRRTGVSTWPVFSAAVFNISASGRLLLNETTQYQNSSALFNSTAPTSSVFTLGSSPDANNSGSTYVAYLFATVANVSKVGSYTGTGATQTINAGLASGARFVLIKRTDSTGDWFVWDTARGMVAGTDPRLALNSTAAELNNNWVYTIATGFQIVTTDASVNASGGTYIYLAIA